MASSTTIQNSLSAGELSPGIFGRTDEAKYHNGTSTCRNFFANYRGGVSSRAGLAYVGTCLQAGNLPPPRDIPFQFSINQGYVLEFGEKYLRVKFNGAYVTESALTVVSVSAGGLFTTSTPHVYNIGDWVYDLGNTGFNGLQWQIATIPSSTTFTVNDLFGNAITSATPSTGGTVARVYTTVTPYASVDLPYLKYAQSADTMTLTCVNIDTGTEYPPYDLVRISNTDWVFSEETFNASILPPVGLTAAAYTSGTLTTWYSYVVTAVDSSTGEESIASLPANVQNVDIGVTLGSNNLSWLGVPAADSYNVYAAVPSYGLGVPVTSLYGFIGTSLGPSFVDTNITPDFTQVPPQHSNPFARGAIESINITNQGDTHYDQETVSYSISTATGSNFAGSPSVSEPFISGITVIGGGVDGFVVQDGGENYTGADTITFSDSGGQHANGTLVFGSNPSAAAILYFNSIKVVFAVPPLPSPTAAEIYTPVENTLALTLQSLANTLNSSNLLSISVAEYGYNPTTLAIVYKTPGTVGNSYQYGTTPTSLSLSQGGTAGTGATGTLNIGPESGTYPAVVSYFQQRRVYANSLNSPDTYWMSQPGLFTNMDSSIPVTGSDAITGTPWAQQVNGIQWLVPMPGGLVVLTGKGAWQVNGGGQAAITPSSQTATPQAYNGCNNLVQPITINYDILYVQSKGSIFRDLSYNFFTNIYTGTDLTVWSSHLFTNFSIIQAAYAEEPYKLVWAVRNDGVLLCLTYLKEQEMYSWTRHDTNGLFVGVCSVTELPVDAVYVIVKRYVQGGWRYYSERMDNRIWDNVEDSYCVDAGLQTPLVYPVGDMSPSAATGSGVTFVSTSGFNSANIGQIIRIDGGKAIITSVTDQYHIVCDILEPLTDLIPNDPTFMPVPAGPGDWSLSFPVSTISGLNHLEGLTVTALADGSVSSLQTVVDGSITLDQPASLVTVGLPYTCQVQTMYLDAPTQGGTMQDKRKNISAVGLRVEASRGLKMGADQIDSSTRQNFASPPWINLVEIKERTNQVNAGVGTPLFTGDYYQAITSGWAVEGQVAVQQDYPLPANILSTVAYYDVGDDR